MIREFAVPRRGASYSNRTPWSRRRSVRASRSLTRYLELLNRDSLLAPVSGVFAAQQIKPQAKTLAVDRGIRCLTLDYDKMRGMDSDEFRLF